MDIPTLLRVQAEIKEVQRVMCENENSHDLYELIKEVCQACDWEVEKLINEEKSNSFIERLKLSEQLLTKQLDEHNHRLINLENKFGMIKLEVKGQ